MSRSPRSLLRWLLVLVGLMVVIGAGLAGFLDFWMHRSLPKLDGTQALSGLAAPVTVERDGLGIPTIHAQSRADAARALGFLHTQDRFFQMDLMRRKAAGELSELFGEKTLEMDKASRLHEFRKRSQETIEVMDPKDRAVVQAYADGVNAGLAALAARPFEYLVLGVKPTAWKPEDSLLCGYAMVLDLEDPTAKYKRDLAALTSAYGFEGLNFFAPVETPDDAALDGSTAPLPPFPKPSHLNLHQKTETSEMRRPNPAVYAGGPEADRIDLGSNSFAVDGAHAGGQAVLAGNIDLNISIPNTWYRAVIDWPGHSVAGVTLPGLPYVVAGSNGRIAWTWTVGYADMGDLITITTQLSPTLYAGPGQGALLQMESHTETIRVKGKDPVQLATHWTRWGPILPGTDETKPLAYLWAFDQPHALDFELSKLEEATTTPEAIDIARKASLPCFNFMVGDDHGHIGWAVAGSLPKRRGFDGRTPVTFSFADRSWDGRLAPEDHPSLVDPKDGFLFSANQRMIGGRALERLGDGGYARPARAVQTRDDLKALVARNTPTTPADLFAVQLDDRALLLAPWRDMLLKTLASAPQTTPGLGKLQDIVAHQWEGKAIASSTSYRLVKAFRLAVAARVFDPIAAEPIDRYDAFDWKRINYEAPLRQMLAERPIHLLDSQYASWDDLLLKAAQDVVDALGGKDGSFAHATWGELNTCAISHPFTMLAPQWLTGWLRMPADQLDGDTDMPRVQGPAYGGSVRFAVSPGKEAQGILEMPCGQSGNPVSPYFRAGHEAWVHGDPSPFLPGRTEHTLTLSPL